MKMKIIFASIVVLLAAGCASDPKSEDLKTGGAECAKMCKENPEVKEYSQSHGGGIALLLIGGEAKKCTCHR